jgi:hypothetical protein
MNKISKYNEILATYGKPSLKEFSRFNINTIKKAPKTDKQEDDFESYCNNLSIQLIAILKF